MLKKILIISLVWLFFLPNFSAAQKSSRENNYESPLEVRANVLVLDAEGEYVDDLKPEDIKVFEDGVEQKISYLAKKEPVLNLGFLIDNTGSMRFQFEKIMETAIRIVDGLGERDEAFIVRFVDTEKTKILADWTSSKSLLKREINGMYIEGGMSAVVDAINLGWMKLAQRENENKTQKYALVLISDCEDRESASDISQILSKLKNSDIQIHVVALTGELDGDSGKKKKKNNPRAKAEAFAADLALQTGGRVFFPASQSKPTVEDIVSSLTNEFRSQYVVRYISTNQDRQKSERKLTVQVTDGKDGEKRRGTIRENLVLPNN